MAVMQMVKEVTIAGKRWLRIGRREDQSFLIEVPEAPDLINQLCAIPPVKELIGTVPLVLYFGNDADRDEMAALVHAAKPGMRAVKP